MNNVPVIKFKNVKLKLGNRQIYNDLNLDINPGDFIAVLGPNGAGKSTLLKLILGLLKPTLGEISVFNEKVKGGNSSIGYAPQSKQFDPDTPITGAEYVRLGLNGTNWGISFNKKDDDVKISNILSQFDSLNLSTKKIGRISGGEIQRLSLCQALISEPKLLLLDEPLANLDIAHQKDIVEKINQNHKEHNHTILLVVHDVNPLLPYINKVIYIVNGNIKIGTPEEVIKEEVLSELYGTSVKVFDIEGKIFVATNDEIIH